MIENYLCENCNKNAVCKVKDILDKFHEDSKKSLGVDITIDRCVNYCEDAAHEG